MLAAGFAKVNAVARVTLWHMPVVSNRAWWSGARCSEIERAPLAEGRSQRGPSATNPRGGEGACCGEATHLRI